jgi:hypothetical protein
MHLLNFWAENLSVDDFIILTSNIQ